MGTLFSTELLFKTLQTTELLNPFPQENRSLAKVRREFTIPTFFDDRLTGGDEFFQWLTASTQAAIWQLFRIANGQLMNC